MEARKDSGGESDWREELSQGTAGDKVTCTYSASLINTVRQRSGFVSGC